jgi:hypothetical protein
VSRTPIPGSLTLVVLAGAIVLPSVNAQEPLKLRAIAVQVGKYQPVELLIDAPMDYQHPNDPDEVDLSVELSSPSGSRLRLPAFCDQPCERKDLLEGRGHDVWIYPSGSPQWKARFAPSDLGHYRATAMLRDRTGTSRSDTIDFESVRSTCPGFMRVSRSDECR